MQDNTDYKDSDGSAPKLEKNDFLDLFDLTGTDLNLEQMEKLKNLLYFIT